MKAITHKQIEKKGRNNKPVGQFSDSPEGSHIDNITRELFPTAEVSYSFIAFGSPYIFIFLSSGYFFPLLFSYLYSIDSRLVC